jgi:hypothetical protein
LLLYPKRATHEQLDAQPELYAAVFEALRAIETDAFVAQGRVYGGGLHKIEPAELGRLPADHIQKLFPQLRRQLSISF